MKMRIAICSLFLLMKAFGWAQVKTLPETRNAALRYWQAFSELKDPPPSQDLQAEIEKVLNQGADWDEPKLGGLVVANEIALGIMQRATKLPDCDWGVEYSRGPEASIAFVARANVLARLNTLQGIREVEHGHPQRAVEIWIAGIRFSQDLTKGGSLLFALTAKSVLTQELRAIAVQAKRGHLNGSQKRQLLGAIAALPEDGFDWGTAWEMDEAGADVFFSQVQRSQEPTTLWEKMMGQSAPADCMPPNAQEVGLYHAYMSEVASALRLPPPAAKQSLADLDSKEKTLCESIRIAIPSADRVNDARLEIISARSELLKALR